MIIERAKNHAAAIIPRAAQCSRGYRGPENKLGEIDKDKRVDF